MKMKLMTIVGTRPEIIKLSEIIKKCDLYFDHILVHTGQNYDYSLNEIFFKEFNLRNPDVILNVAGNNLGESIGNIISKSYDVINRYKPDGILILGDTNSCLSAISAKRLKVPIFHMEAGNRCFDENLPEEINRRIIDHISDVNLCYTENARTYINFEGVSKERTYVVGSPMAEILHKYRTEIMKSLILEKLDLTPKKYILISAHREENIDNELNFYEIMNAINDISSKYEMPIIYSMHPRSKKYIEQREFKFHKNVQSMIPFSFVDYNALQLNALCVISDSGTLAEEASFYKFPAVSLRTSTERPEALDKGNMIIGNTTSKSLIQSVEMAITMNENSHFGSDVQNYIDTNVSIKVVKLIQSYIPIVNKKVWHKE